MTSLRAFPVLMAAAMTAMLVVIGGAADARSQWYSQPNSSPCGSTVYKSGGEAWQCTFADDFSGGQLDTSKWLPQTNQAVGSASAYACYMNSPANIGVSSGALHLTVRKNSTAVACGTSAPTYYTAGMVSTFHLFSQQYGRFEARVRNTATTQPGLHEAFWLWPDDRYTKINWPTTGEIDVAETYSNYANLTVPYLHYTANDNGGPITGTNTAYCATQRGVWNTYVLEWTPSSITISINGKTCLVNTSGNAAFNQRYIMMFSATLGFGADSLTSATPLPATTDVDYVHVWK